MSKVLTGFDRNPNCGLSFIGTTGAKQSFRDECDINKIMKTWQLTGEFSHVNRLTPTYGDFSNPTDYQEALHQIEAAQADFDALPSEVRRAMGNDPGTLLEFMADPANLEEAQRLGLVPPDPPEAPEPKPGVQPDGDKAPEPPPDKADPPSPISGGD